MPEFKILVVEDDRSIQNLITTALKINQYTYLNAYNGTEAISTCMSHNPDLILLDLGLPDIDGIEVIKTVRTWSNVPIVVISARDEDSDKIEALDSGADDYLTKPFSVQEMLARIRAVQRRQQYLPSPEHEKSVFENGRLKIDYAAGTAELDGNELHLTPIEYKILCLLSRNVGKVL
ncbi:MAG: response regulator transcription factor, partial [Erysipelotrichaceae bacterium]|nr:response regulator transcription factor [Erysipelotrichaceae bacterium]